MEFQVRYSALILLFPVIDSFKWFWMESLHNNIQLMLGFLKAPFLALHFSCYTLMTFLVMLSVKLLSMLMILLSILSMIRHLVSSNKLNWLLNLNLIYKTLCTGVRSGLLISMLGKLIWFHLTGLITIVLLMWKWMDLFLRKNNLLGLGLNLSSILDWGFFIISIAKTAYKKVGALIRSIKFFLLRLLCISINLPYIHVWNTVGTSGLVPLVATWNC